MISQGFLFIIHALFIVNVCLSMLQSGKDY